jgi:hypothetical protein
MIFDQHNGSVPLRYRVSVEGLISNPEEHEWETSKFGRVLGALPGIPSSAVGNKFFTYPRFITMPNGNLQLIRRHGSAISGASHIYTYDKDTEQWTHHGEFLNGRAVEYTKPDTGAKTKLGPYLNGAIIIITYYTLLGFGELLEQPLTITLILCMRIVMILDLRGKIIRVK